MENHGEILAEFTVEAREILDQLDTDFVVLEKAPDDKKLIGNIFRGLHTLKGSSGFFALKRLEKISHAGESLLGKIRDGQLTLDTEKTSKLLQMIDVLRIIIEGIENNRAEPPGDDQTLIQELMQLSRNEKLASRVETPPPPPPPPVSAAPAPAPTAAPTPAPTPSSSGMSAENHGEILAEFTVEAREILDQLDTDFVVLEKAPDDKKLIGNIFRGLHTLKGSSGFFALKRLEKISHAGESLLGKIRDGQLTLDTEKTSKLLQMIDVLRIIIEGIENNRAEPPGDDQTLIQELMQLSRNEKLASRVETPPPPPPPPVSAAPAPAPTAAPTPAPTPSSSGMSAENHGEILAEFTVEAREILDQLDTDFVVLEKAPDDKKLIGNIFRGLHTLKGSSGFFALKRLEKISHAGESLLGKIRDGQLTLDTEKTSKLLQMIDVLRIIIEGIENNRAEPPGDDQTLIQELMQLSRNEKLASRPASATTEIPKVAETKPPSPEPVAATQAQAEPSPSAAPEPSAPASNKEVANRPAEANNASPAVNPELAAPVKVNPETLDKLMNLASEMVLARNRLLPYSTQSEDVQFNNTVRSIDLLTLELQERMMKMRMQSISHVWSKFPRLVRDVSNDTKKKVRLVQEGAETELDRTLLDGIRDPLVHIIRNSIDHSIEIPEIRLAKGKTETADLILRASHQNGMVVVEISDDGAGINYELVRKRGVDKNLVSAEVAQNLTRKQLIDLIFLPGFSTKETVTNLSGRGVGMDVVKNNITNIGGSIEITSEPDQGTNIKLKIPLTLAIMPALFVSSGDEVFAIPENRILELVRLNNDDPNYGIEDFYGTPTFRLRDKLVPLLFLNKQLELKNAESGPEKSPFVIILFSNGARFGLAVEAVLNIQDVVVKPMGPLLKSLIQFTGATIMGNGRVSLILDVDGIATQSGLVEKIKSNPLPIDPTDSSVHQTEVSMLLFEIAGLEKIALPLDPIDHILRIPANQIQNNGNREVIYINDELLHVIRLNQYVSGGDPSAADDQETVSILTCHFNQNTYALVVKRVKDIIQVPENLFALTSPQKGLKACTVYEDQVINIIDLEEIYMLHNMQGSSRDYPATIDMNVS